MHKPVLRESVLSYLKLKPGDIVLDGTVGSGGHAEDILKAIEPTGVLIGLDQDREALLRTQSRLEQIKGRFELKHLNFRDLDQALSSLHFDRVHAVLLDIGVSTEQLEDPKRGFSFKYDGPLDMRMDPANGTTARDLVLTASEDELAQIFRQYGEERYARPIARAIVRERARQTLATTGALKALIEKLTPARRRYAHIHPATRVFQALRIAVNDELEALKEALAKAFDHLETGGRLAVISFHSLEDRMVKRFFVEQKIAGRGVIMTKKPVRPSAQEAEENPRSRSAKLRVIERK